MRKSSASLPFHTIRPPGLVKESMNDSNRKLSRKCTVAATVYRMCCLHTLPTTVIKNQDPDLSAAAYEPYSFIVPCRPPFIGRFRWDTWLLYNQIDNVKISRIQFSLISKPHVKVELTA